MPRKRGTRAKAPTPEKIPGLSVTEEMTQKELEEQLKVVLKEYDVKVKNFLRQYEMQCQIMKSKIKQACDLQVTAMSMEVRQMTLEEFAVTYGTFENNLAGIKINTQQQNFEASTKEDVKAQLKVDFGLKTIKEKTSEEALDENVEPQTAKARRKKNAPPPSTSTSQGRPTRASTRASRSKNPATGRMTYLPTPLVTPAFAPKLPKTPAVGGGRNRKPGERLYSIQGSPLEEDDNSWSRGIDLANVEEKMEELSEIVGKDLNVNIVERLVGVLLK